MVTFIIINMSRECFFTGKKTVFGKQISHSNKRTKRKFLLNMQRYKIIIPRINKFFYIKISTAGIRTLRKKSLK